MLLVLLVGSVVFFAFCYKFYGAFMSRIYGLDDAKKTPAEVLYDGVDYVPAHPAVLLGHHFSSVAGAGPIVGPITAAGMFGWLPAYLWCVIGSAFLGGPHDMGSLVASMRHQGKSMGEVVDRWIGRAGKILFLCFTILALVLIVAVFLQLSANSFASDPTVAFAASLYILLALIFGVLIYRMNVPLWLMTVIMVPLILYACWMGTDNPWITKYFSFSGNPELEFYRPDLGVPAATAANFEAVKKRSPELSGFATFEEYKVVRDAKFEALKAESSVLRANDVGDYESLLAVQKKLHVKNVNAWRWVLLVYIFLASVMPVWLLLQPRDYLASYFLYFAVIIGTVGMVGGGAKFPVHLPAFKGFVSSNGQYLWPILFIVVACGAISGFHALVGSGTTSKQIRKEKDAVLVGYGSMLIEGVVAVVALGTVMIAGGIINDPVNTYAIGFGRFAELLGINQNVGKSLGLLALNSFLLTSLDTATRLTRYQVQEITNMRVDRYTATVFAVVAAMALLLTETHTADGKVIPVWAAIWPVFGAANQLVGALVLLALGVWVTKSLKKPNHWLMYPMWFMLVTTVTALFLMVYDTLIKAPVPNWILGGLAIALLVLSLLMVVQAFKALREAKETA